MSSEKVDKMHFIKWGTQPLRWSHKVTEEVCDRVAIQNSLPLPSTTTSLKLSFIIYYPTRRKVTSLLLSYSWILAVFGVFHHDCLEKHWFKLALP